MYKSYKILELVSCHDHVCHEPVPNQYRRVFRSFCYSIPAVFLHVLGVMLHMGQEYRRCRDCEGLRIDYTPTFQPPIEIWEHEHGLRGMNWSLSGWTFIESMNFYAKKCAIGSLNASCENLRKLRLKTSIGRTCARGLIFRFKNRSAPEHLKKLWCPSQKVLGFTSVNAGRRVGCLVAVQPRPVAWYKSLGWCSLRSSFVSKY